MTLPVALFRGPNMVSLEGHAPFRFLPAEDASIFLAGFTGNPVAIFAHNPANAFAAGQVQEPCIFEDPEVAGGLVMYYASMAFPDREDQATWRSAIWRAKASASAPTVWTDHTMLVTNVARGWTYLRLDSVVRVDGVWRFYVSNSGQSVYTATSSDGLALTFHGSAVLTSGGQGRNDGQGVAQMSVVYEDGTYRAIYGTADLLGYYGASSSDGIAWTKTGSGPVLAPTPESYDATGIEWHSLFKMGETWVLIYEGCSGTNWFIGCATAPSYLGPWTKFPSPVLAAYGDGFASQHVATPRPVKIGALWYLFFQGSETLEDVGGFSPWDMGIAILNPPS